MGLRTPSDLDHSRSKALALAVEIANRMNCSLVLPRFPCNKKYRLEWCNLCGSDDTYCYARIMKTAKLPWKEHVPASANVSEIGIF